LFLFGTMLFKWATSSRLMPPLSHLSGLTLLLILTPIAFGHGLSALALGTLTTVILMVVATWESAALRRPVKGSSKDNNNVKDRPVSHTG
jgi:low temperature requirement protein LtrA